MESERVQLGLGPATFIAKAPNFSKIRGMRTFHHEIFSSLPQRHPWNQTLHTRPAPHMEHINSSAHGKNMNNGRQELG